jgi:hypothetical protein
MNEFHKQQYGSRALEVDGLQKPPFTFVAWIEFHSQQKDQFLAL